MIWFCVLFGMFPGLQQVEPNAHKIEEHRRKYDRLRKEREEKKIERERQCRRAEAQVTVFPCSIPYKLIILSSLRD